MADDVLAREAGANVDEECSPLRLERLARPSSLWLSTLTGQSQMADVVNERLSQTALDLH
jgi:hypothetical protein